jgi:hypothetical protein
MKRPDFPKFVKGCGYAVDAVDAVVLKIRQAQAGTITGPNADLRRVKIQREIERIEQDVRLRKLDGDERDRLLIPREDAIRSARELCVMMTDTLAQWLAAVRVLTGDAQLVAEAERLRDRCLLLMQEKIKAS